MRRTVPVTLDVDSQDAALLADTIDEFLWAAQSVTDHAFHGEYVTSRHVTSRHVTPSKTTLNEDSARARTGVHAESPPLEGEVS
nr:MAG: hypothetical protein J07AB56_03560 [Candidatus Nanosalinarum sp. J07AB56]